LEYPLDHEEAERLRRYCESRGNRVELVWMTPQEFLSKVPHPATPLVSALFDLRRKWFDKTSLGYIRKAVLSESKLPPLILDYTHMVGRWPSHEGRHRTYIALTHGIERVPVLVVKKGYPG